MIRVLFFAMTWIGVAACNESFTYCQGGVCLSALAKQADVNHRLLLIGDAGAPAWDREGRRMKEKPILIALQNYAKLLPDKSTVVFLGDNIYEQGLPDEDNLPQAEDENCERRACAEMRIDAQINVARESGAQGIFVPGNHDWDNGGTKGWKRIRNLGGYISGSKKTGHLNVALIPEKGCPGPKTVLLGGENGKAALVVLDTQWWLHQYEKPGRNHRGGCSRATEQEVLQALKLQLTDAKTKDRWVVVAAHHPLQSWGEHSGNYFFKGLGDFFFMIKQWGRINVYFSPQEMNHPVYLKMKRAVEKVLEAAAGKRGAPIIYASGHEHDLQVIEGGGRAGAKYFLVSGLGTASRAGRVWHGDRSLFAHAAKDGAGFMVLDFLENGRVRLTVIEQPLPGPACGPAHFEPCEIYSRFLG
ncbi:MAG: metallophosphoesterase [Nitrospinaceae bacterium]